MEWGSQGLARSLDLGPWSWMPGMPVLLLFLAGMAAFLVYRALCCVVGP